MATSIPFEALSPRSEQTSDVALNVPDEQDVAHWAAFYESLPADLREGLDEIGCEIGRGMSKR
ncbi:MAG: hypothetical protein QM820_18525 [Minicystis sp.]